MNIPRIRIEDTDEISILICYLIYTLGCPLTQNQLIEITSLEDAVSYFNLVQAIENADGRLLQAVELNKQKAYSNTEMGIKAARELGNSIPLSVREKMFEEAVRIYTRDSMKKTGSFLSVRYSQKNDDKCTVSISIMDTDTAKQRYSITVETDTTEKAEEIQNKIRNNPNKLAKILDDFFFDGAF